MHCVKACLLWMHQAGLLLLQMSIDMLLLHHLYTLLRVEMGRWGLLLLLLCPSRLLLGLLPRLHMLHRAGDLSHPLLRPHSWPHLILLMLRRLLMLLLETLMWMLWMHRPRGWSTTERLLLRRLLMLESVHLLGLLLLRLLHSLLHLHLLRLLLLVEAVLLGVHLWVDRLLTLLRLLLLWMRSHLYVLRHLLATHMLAVLTDIMLLLLHMLWMSLHMLWLAMWAMLLWWLLMLCRHTSLRMALRSESMIQTWTWPPFEHMR